MSNTTTIIMNDYATAIAENRFIASAQLTADDFTSTESAKASELWKQYRQLCDNLAVACWNSLRPNHEGDDNLAGMSLAGLFKFFGTDAKATTANQNRILLSCVTITRKQSDAMKKARKEKNEAKKKYNKAVEAKKSEEEISALKQDFDNKSAVVEEMESQPHNVWYDKKPMLDKSLKHATPKCRKLIEDTIADIMTERAMMSEEDKAKEALAGLKSAAGYLRRQLGTNLRLRYSPEIVWAHDDSITYGAKMLGLINSLGVKHDEDTDEE